MPNLDLSETQLAYLTLNLIPQLGPVRLRRLLEKFGTPEEILRASPARLEAGGVGAAVALAIANWSQSIDLREELRYIANSGVTVLTWCDAEYPAQLLEIHDPPVVLYVRGELRPADRHAVGVVGTRKPSHYATEATKKITYQLAYCGLTVVSGLARGVDAVAHQTALAAKGRTIAVVGSGLSALYPPEHRGLADRIADGGGAVISELPMRTGADRQTFPMRNRIISGLSFGLLVVEAGDRSGALISANDAAEQGRSIYAVPGRITDPGAVGSNRLIQQGAKLVTSAQDILDEFGLLFREKPELVPSVPMPDLPADLVPVYTALGSDELHIDAIASKCRLPLAEVSSSLLALEMRKLVKQLPGSRFVRIN